VVFDFPAGTGAEDSITARTALGVLIEGQARPASHALWERDGLNLSMVLPLAVEDLWAGNSLRIMTPYTVLEYCLPDGACLTTPIRFRGQGVRHADGRCGDLWVVLSPELPGSDGRSLRKEERKALENSWKAIG